MVDICDVAFPLRHAVSLLVVLGALAATVAVFTVARPEYHPHYESKMIDFARLPYRSPPHIRAVFLRHGIRLYAGAAPVKGGAWLGASQPPVPSASLQVMVGPRTGKASWGRSLSPTTCASTMSSSATAAVTRRCWRE
jgi:hypothetical protein